jgi:hypothetical protein
MEEGYRMGKKKGVEDGGEEYEKSLLEGHELGIKNGKEEERRKWLTEGHGPGMCVSTQRHMQEIETSGENAESKEDTWQHGYGYCVSVEDGHLMLVTEVAKAMASKEAEPTTQSDVSTQVAPRTDETAVQTNANPERWCAVIQTEPPDNESPTLTKNAEMTLHVDSSTQTTAFPAPERPPAPRV